MGADMGREIHYFGIWRREKDRRYHVWGGTFNTIDQLDPLMEAFRIRMCVVDGSPETWEVKKFSLRHPGRVVLAQYNTSVKATELIKTEKRKVFPNDARTYTLVTIARTQAMDLVLGGIGKDEVLALDSCSIEDYAKQMVAPRRTVLEIQPGEYAGRWVNEDDDHYYHADVYGMIAAKLAGPVRRELPDAAFV